VPAVAGRVAQTVVAARLEKAVEPVFHRDSYGYRPGRSPLDAVAACRKRCWRKDWVIDLDVEKFLNPWVGWPRGISPRGSHRIRTVAVGTALSGGPPHRSRRAVLPHWAPASGAGVESHAWPWMHDPGWRQPPGGEAVHAFPVQAGALAATP
jgi:hypothetical protein